MVNRFTFLKDYLLNFIVKFVRIYVLRLGVVGYSCSVGITGRNKTALLEKTTGNGVANLQGFSKEGQAFYKPYFDHYKTLIERSRNNKFFPNAEQVATKLLKIA